MTKQKYIKLFLTLIGLLIIIFSGVFVINSLNYLDNLKLAQVKFASQKNNIKNFQNNILKPTPDLKDWKTYKNEEFGFSIQYPPNYLPPDNEKAKEINLTEKNIRPDLVFWGSFMPKEHKMPTNNELPVLYGIYGMRVFANAEGPAKFLDSSIHDQYNSIISQEKNQNDLLFYQVDTSGLTSTFAFVTFKNNKVYQIDFDKISQDDKDYSVYQENIKKIIDSFKIIID